jgi:serine/threonine-protein kinase
MEKKNIFRRYLPAGILVALAAMLIGILLMDMVIMPLIVGKHRGAALVPNVVHLAAFEASKLIKDAGLVPERMDDEFSDLVKEGKVCIQKPEFGDEVKSGRTVYYSLSKGSEIVSLPDLAGRTIRQAMIQLKNIGLETGKIRYAYSDSVGPDCIISSTPDSGSVVMRGTKVALLASQGVEPTESRVPNLVGEPFSNSRKLIKQAGLELGTVQYKVNKELVPETIIFQSLSPDSKVPRGSKIDLVITTLGT